MTERSQPKNRMHLWGPAVIALGMVGLLLVTSALYLFVVRRCEPYSSRRTLEASLGHNTGILFSELCLSYKEWKKGEPQEIVRRVYDQLSSQQFVESRSILASIANNRVANPKLILNPSAEFWRLDETVPLNDTAIVFVGMPTQSKFGSARIMVGVDTGGVPFVIRDGEEPKWVQSSANAPTIPLFVEVSIR